MSSVVIDGSAFRAALLGLEGDIVHGAETAIVEGVDAAAKDAFSTNLFRNHTWKLRSSTKATVDHANFRGSIRNATPYARFIEEGTRAHVIKPRKAKMLRWYSHRHGGWVSSKGVNHPGTKPRPFFAHAGQVGGATIQNRLEHLTEQRITRWNRAA